MKLTTARINLEQFILSNVVVFFFFWVLCEHLWHLASLYSRKGRYHDEQYLQNSANHTTAINMDK